MPFIHTSIITDWCKSAKGERKKDTVPGEREAGDTYGLALGGSVDEL